MNYETPCIESVIETFSSMCGVSPELSGESEQMDTPATFKTAEILGIIGLSGSRKGDIMITMDSGVAKKMIGAFIMEEITELNSDFFDAFGEIINIIAGAFAAKLEGMSFELALPTVMAGELQTHIRGSVSCVSIPMTFEEWGDFKVLVMMEEA